MYGRGEGGTRKALTSDLSYGDSGLFVHINSVVIQKNFLACRKLSIPRASRALRGPRFHEPLELFLVRVVMCWGVLELPRKNEM